MIVLRVGGLPVGVDATVTISGPSGTFSARGSATYSGLAPGTYGVTASDVLTGSAVARPTPVSQSITLRDNETRVVTISYALAGAFSVRYADIIVASERATFGLTEINVGALGGSSKALRMVGPFKARMLFFSGQLVPAAELYRLGAVEEVVPDGQAEQRAVEIGGMFAAKSPIGLRLAKESLLRIEGDGMEAQYRTEQDYSARLRNYDDSGEARNAYLEKRAPKWTWS